MKKQNKKKFPHKQQHSSQQKNDSSSNNQKSKISANGVKRVAFYITDKELGKQRKVIALGSFYIETLKTLGVDNVPAWLGNQVQDYLSIHGKDSSWIHIVEFMIFQSLLKRITP